MFYGIKEVVGTLTTGSHAGERVIASPGENIEVRGDLSRSIELPATGSFLILQRQGFSRVIAMRDVTKENPKVLGRERIYAIFVGAAAVAMAVAALVGFTYFAPIGWICMTIAGALAVISLAEVSSLPL